MAKNSRDAYGLGKASPTARMAVLPIESKRAPIASDLGYEIGTLWINIDTDRSWLLVSVANNAAVWSEFIVVVPDVTAGKIKLVNSTFVVPTTAIRADSVILLTARNSHSGSLYADTIVAGVSFSVHLSVGGQTPFIDWMIT